VIKEMDLTLADGRALHCYDSGDAHGGQDRLVPSEHGAWLAARCPDAELWLRPDDGHVSVLGSCGVAALDWLVAYV
jgi:hypothetical protein